MINPNSQSLPEKSPANDSIYPPDQYSVSFRSDLTDRVPFDSMTERFAGALTTWALRGDESSVSQHQATSHLGKDPQVVGALVTAYGRFATSGEHLDPDPVLDQLKTEALPIVSTELKSDKIYRLGGLAVFQTESSITAGLVFPTRLPRDIFHFIQSKIVHKRQYRFAKDWEPGLSDMYNRVILDRTFEYGQTAAAIIRAMALPPSRQSLLNALEVHTQVPETSEAELASALPVAA